MAKPRVFVSSTYYDLKYIRADLERFVSDYGFDPVLNEKGHIPYGSEEKLEEYCYKEIELCDILISVIGGRFGSEGKETDYSISNLELKTAIDNGKQVYIFIEKSVFNEYSFYDANKEKDDITYTAVDDIRVHKFISEIYELPLNNQVKNFETTSQITLHLQEQWAGLFQRLLSESARQKEVKIIEDLKNTSNTLNHLVSYLIDEKSRGNQAINDILLTNHPAFDAIRKSLEIPYRIFFETMDELSELLKARQYIEEDNIFDDWGKDGFCSFKRKKSDIFFRVSNELFDENRKLKVFTPEEWNNQLIELEDNEDIPF